MTEFRASTLEEREEFYKNEFDFEKIRQMKFKPQFYAIDLGSKTGITKFPDKKNTLMMLSPNLTPEQLKEKLIHYLPEGVYYDRNIYEDANDFFKNKNFKKFWTDKNYQGQELCFDVDAENIKEVEYEKTEEYSKVIQQSAQKALETAELLRKNQEFKDITFVYSGRGFHVKVHDEGTEKLTFRQRDAINETLEGMPIDKWVSGGHSKLMRLPFSLHGVVSRIATPLEESELESFNPIDNEKIIPQFLK